MEALKASIHQPNLVRPQGRRRSARQRAAAPAPQAPLALTGSPTASLCWPAPAHIHPRTPLWRHAAAVGVSASVEGSAGSLPSAQELAGLAPAEKLRLLQQAQQASRQVVEQAIRQGAYSGPGAYGSVSGLGPGAVDRKLYEQLVAAQHKLSQKLSETNRHIGALEGTIMQYQQDLMQAHELLNQISMEFGTTARMAQAIVAAARFGVDTADAMERLAALEERLVSLEAGAALKRDELGARVPRRVPLEWVGVASQVTVMGDFDGWTRGVELSAEDVTSDSVYARFEGALLLQPGTYRVKLLVDGEWRLCADWPNEDDGEGNTVNLLTV